MTYHNAKIHKKAELHPLSRRYIFGKTTGGGGSNWQRIRKGRITTMIWINWHPAIRKITCIICSTYFLLLRYITAAPMDQREKHFIKIIFLETFDFSSFFFGGGIFYARKLNRKTIKLMKFEFSAKSYETIPGIFNWRFQVLIIYD